MATNIRWPDGLPVIVTAGKTRSSPASYRFIKSRAGPGFRKNTSKNVPVSWNVTFKFSRDDAKIFWSWYVNVLERGRNSFILPVKTEFGLTDYEVNLLPDNLIPLDESDGTFTYSATLYSKGLIIPKKIEIDVYSQVEYYCTLPDYVELYSQVQQYCILADYSELYSDVIFYACKV